MSLRFLLGILAPGPQDRWNDSQSSEYEINPQEKDMYASIQIKDFQSPAKFHIGMLSISLIIGLALGGFIAYTNWRMGKRPFSSYVISLLIALVCRTFFSILFDGVILLGSGTVGGGNTLLAFEQICINLVLAFWLSLTIYLHACVQRNFKSEPTLNLYRYGVPGAAVFFAFIWIFLLQSQFPSALWWFFLSPFTQWVVNSFNLLCILIQLALVGDIARMMMKISLDNDSISLFRKVAILMGVLVFIFWLQFGLFMGRWPLKNSSSYTYFFYFVDGIQCASVCLILYFFNNWVEMLLNSNARLNEAESVNSVESNNEELLAGSGGRGIVTLDTVFMTRESGKLKNPEEEGPRDVVYSNVVEPQRLKNILDLYKRLNIIRNNKVTVVEEEKFYDCQTETDQMSKRVQRSISDESKKRTSSDDRCLYKKDKMCDHIQKKNAFYSSKYLILDSKGDVPKYLETRPSLTSTSGRGSSKEDKMNKDYSTEISPVKTEERVRKWLCENSENMPKKDSLTQRTEEENDLEKKHESDVSRHKPVLETAMNAQDTTQPTENRVSVTQKILTKIDSVLWFPFPGTDDKKNTTPENEDLYREEASKQHLTSNVSCELNEQIRSEPEIEEKEHAETLNQSNSSWMGKILSLGRKADESDKPGEALIRQGRKEYESKQPDAEDSEAKHGYLNQYLTNSELQERRKSREMQAIDQQRQGTKSVFSFPETISLMMDYFVSGSSNLPVQKTHPVLLNTEHLKVDNVPRSESEAPMELQSRKTEMKDETQAVEKVSESVAVPSKAVGEEERIPMKKKSISSGSEFSIERFNIEQPRQELVTSAIEKLPKSIENPYLDSKIQRASMEETNTSSEFSTQSRKYSSSSSGSFSIEQYYHGLQSAKQKVEQRSVKPTLRKGET